MSEVVWQSEQNEPVMRARGIIHSSTLTHGDQNLCCYSSADLSATTALSCCC